MNLVRHAFLVGISVIAMSSVAMADNAKPSPTAPAASPASVQAPASATPAAASHGVFATLPPVVEVFRQMFRPGVSKDVYLKGVESVYAKFFSDNDVLTQATIEKLDKVFHASMRAQRVASILAADLDGDGKVSRDEVKELMHVLRPAVSDVEIKAKTDQMFSGLPADAQFITLEDMLKSSSTVGIVSPDRKLGEQLLVLSSDKKKLVKAEFYRLATEAFDKVDANHSGTIDKEEVDVLLNMLPQTATPHPAIAPVTPPAIAPATPPVAVPAPAVAPAPTATPQVKPAVPHKPAAPRKPAVQPKPVFDGNGSPAGN